MDTTPKYILMCEKAKKIQEYRKNLKIGDYVVRFWRKQDSGGRGGSAGQGIVNWTAGIQDGYWSHTIIGDPWSHYRDEAIYLPRQDELQVLSDLVWRLFDYKCLEYQGDTKEQAGIRLVMYEKYQKQWDEEMQDFVK